MYIICTGAIFTHLIIIITTITINREAVTLWTLLAGHPARVQPPRFLKVLFLSTTTTSSHSLPYIHHVSDPFLSETNHILPYNSICLIQSMMHFILYYADVS